MRAAGVACAWAPLAPHLADVAQQLHEPALHGALLELDLGEAVPLAPARAATSRVSRSGPQQAARQRDGASRFLECRLLHADDAALAAAVRPQRRNAILAEAVLVRELQDDEG